MLRLIELRKLNQLSQKKFAEKLNVAQNTVSNWERGYRSPDTNMLKVISEYFGVSIDYLLGHTNAPTVENKKTPDANTSGKVLFSDEEYSMLLKYRMLNDIEKADVRGYINGKVSSSHNSKVNELPCSAG